MCIRDSATRELRSLLSDPIPGVTLDLYEADPSRYSWLVTFEIQQGQTLTAHMRFPELFPLRPPIITLASPFWHPNVREPDQVLDTGFPDGRQLRLLISRALLLLEQPDLEKAVNPEATAAWRHDPTGFAAAQAARAAQLARERAAAAAEPGSFHCFAAVVDHSLLKELVPDPGTETHEFMPNKTSREVLSGHYVLVATTPLPDPYLLSYSPVMAAKLGLSEHTCTSPEFLKFLSGEPGLAPEFKSWATPYAVSIMGDEVLEVCPFGTGNGYGDGRTISVAEVAVNGQRWELQLKGAGTTPFCRSGDGKAVLRSSVREYLAQLAMSALGVPTTESLSLVASQTQRVKRPWYGSQSAMIRERCAVTCRVAPSFLRVGQIELFGRRAREGVRSDELAQIVEHTIRREFPEIRNTEATLAQRTLDLLREAAARFQHLTAEWIRVGFSQGNFNSDNCLVGGRTLDYGPFGFCEKYRPNFAKWVGSGDHFGFMSQPAAGFENWQSLVRAVGPLLDQEDLLLVGEMSSGYMADAKAAVDQVWRRKLGFSSWGEEHAQLWACPLTGLHQLLHKHQADYTLFWRQLSHCLSAPAPVDQLEVLRGCFYGPNMTTAAEQEWLVWLGQWTDLISQDPMPTSDKEEPVSYTHLRAHETPEHLVCRLLLEKKKNN
eukprot:TRINITY_DN21346_c0_g1_i6.p1 TRINITY_DN21346_c0_g1~~TRINITY_DN21346_c0_g1_i6.p1  ORF type:complete len:662 (-),score=155.57 TRINITY_DN21346_c0_g1_i6:73-2058(-)